MRSDEVKGGIDRVIPRSLMSAGGLTAEQIKKPIIGVFNSWTNLFSGHATLDKIGEAVKEGILMAGGTPAMTSTIAICDGLCENTSGMKYPLPTRDLIADSVECYAQAHSLDGMICIANCDKIIPGMLMAIMRLNIPAIFISGGGALLDKSRGDPVAISAMAMAAKTGKIDLEELMRHEEKSAFIGLCPGCNGGMGTAVSMQMMAETLGVAPIGTSTIPSMFTERLWLSKRMGQRIVEMVHEDWKPLDYVTKQSFLNCITVDMMMGCSTNTALHVPAIAAEAGFKITLDDFAEASRKTPQICKIAPALSPYFMYDLYRAGGLQAVMKQAIDAGYMDGSTQTYTGHTLAEDVADSKVTNDDCIRPFDNAYTKEGGISVLKGNLAPQGCIIKTAGVVPEMFEHVGKARVFNSEHECYEAVNSGGIEKGDCLVIRYEGPVGGPGMREMLTITNIIRALDLAAHVSLITDGRFSGASVGGVIGHVAPEAALGGLIALVEDGDIIEYSIPNGTINLRVDEETIAKRRAAWTPPEPRVKRGYLARYAQLAKASIEGARMVSDIEEKTQDLK